MSTCHLKYDPIQMKHSQALICNPFVSTEVYHSIYIQKSKNQVQDPDHKATLDLSEP